MLESLFVGIGASRYVNDSRGWDAVALGSRSGRSRGWLRVFIELVALGSAARMEHLVVGSREGGVDMVGGSLTPIWAFSDFW
jgi:hypothetical protein